IAAGKRCELSGSLALGTRKSIERTVELYATAAAVESGVCRELGNSLARLKTEAVADEQTGVYLAIFRPENAGKSRVPAAIARGAVLASVSFDGGDCGNAGGERGGMEKRRAGASQILHTQEHAVLLCGGPHQQGLAVPFAGF